MQTTRMLFRQLIFLLVGLAIVMPVCAQERREYYSGIRQMGMGGVAVSTANDETALILNPAGLGRLRAPILTLIDPEADSSSSTARILTRNQNSDYFAFMEPQSLLDKLNADPDRYLHAAAHVFPSFVTTNFGFGIHGNYTVDGEVVSSPAPAQFNYFYRQDLAAILGVNFRFWDGRIKLGLSGRATNRAEVDTSLPATSTALQLKNLVKEGVGIGGDVGLILTAPWSWLPSLAAVYRDAGGTTFDLNDGFLYDAAERPKYVRPSLDAGFSVSPILSNKIRMTMAGEVRDAMTLGDELDPMKRYHVGLEMNFADMLFLRGGMNQRYWTGGLEFSMRFFQLQIASYGEEIGVSTTTEVKTREDRRYMGKISIRF